MASIVDWQSSGVDFRVEVAQSKGVVYGGTRYRPTLMPGGDQGQPNGWVAWDSGGGAFWPLVTMSVDDEHVWHIHSVSPSTSQQFGAHYEIAGQPDTLYYCEVEVRKHPEFTTGIWRVFLTQYNPTTGVETVMTQAQTYGSLETSWSTVAMNTTAPLNWAGGFTRFRLRVAAQGSALFPDGTWAVDWRRPQIVARDTSFTIDWRDITCDVKSLAWRYGRERFTNRYEVATINMELDNTDGQYSFADPHPLNWGPGRQVRVVATYGGIDYPQAFAIVDSLNDGVDHEGKAITSVVALDPTSIMANRRTPSLNYFRWLLPPFGTGPVKTGGRIGYLVEYVGYPDSDLDDGQWNTQPVVGSGRTIRDEIGVTADSEGGAFFADRSGVLTYRDRTWLTTDDNLTHVTATFSARAHNEQVPFDGVPDLPDAPDFCPSDLVTDWNKSRVINYLSLAVAGGISREYWDDESRLEFGEQEYARTDFVLWGNSQAELDAYLDQRAVDYMTGYTFPKQRLNSLTYRPDLESHDWPWTLSVFLNWLVRVWYQNRRTGWGWLMVTHVQSIEHRVTPLEWSTTLAVDQPVFQSDAPVMVQAFWDGLADSDKWDIALWS